MAISPDEVLKKALELDDQGRARLVSELLATLEPDSKLEALADAEWLKEIERRARAALAGVQTYGWREARSRIEDTFEPT